MLNIITYINIILAFIYLVTLFKFKIIHKKCDCISNHERVQLFTNMILLIFYIVLVSIRLINQGPVTVTELNFWKIWDMVMLISANIYIITLNNGVKHGQSNE